MAGGRMITVLALLAWSLASSADAQSVAEQLSAGKVDALREQATNHSAVATLNTFLGRPDLNADFTDIPGAALDCPVEGTQPQEAAGWILQHTRHASVVMFNENHYQIQARGFVRELLPRLRKAGFTHIGFEAFQPLEPAKEYTPDLGYYTVEPVFAALVRDAKKLGFILFGYESTQLVSNPGASIAESIALREQAQAENLQKAIQSAPKSARFIVFAGWSHITKKPLQDFGASSPSTQWMAARFVAATGIDPFAIDLIGCAYSVTNAVERGGRIYLDSKGRSRVSGGYAGAVDAQVHLPIAGKDHPNQAGYHRSALGVPVSIPKSLLLPDAAVLVAAYAGAAGSRSVAHDRVLLNPGEDFPLYLPPGKYEFEAHRTDGTSIGSAQIEVPAR